MTMTDTEYKAFGTFFLADILNYIGENFDPDEVYDATFLKEWILGNGYVEDDDQ